MLMYLILILICVLVFVDVYGLRYPREAIYLPIVCGLILISAFRYRLGIDSIRYEEIYSDIPTIFNLKFDDFLTVQYEPLWIVFCSILRSVSDSFFFLQLVHAIIINWIFCSFLYRHTNSPLISLFFYMMAMYFLFNFESIRESLAIAVFLVLWEKIKNERYLYCLIFLLCCMIHYGAVILFLIPCVKKIKLGFSTLLITIIGVILIGFFVFELLLKIDLSFVNPLVEYKYRTYINREGVFSLYTLLIYFFIPFCALILWILFVKRQHIFSHFILLYFILLLGSFFIPITLRFANYFLIFYIVFLTDLVNKLSKAHVKTLLRSVWSGVIIIFFSFPYFSWFFIGVANTPYKNYDKYFPYTDIVSKETSTKREFITDVEFL